MPIKVSKIPRICQECGKAFEVQPNKVRSGRAKFCSMLCVRAFHYRNGSIAIAPGFNRGKFHAAECHCGCGTKLEIADHRYKSNKHKRFFVDKSHQIAFLSRRRELNWLRGAGCYGNDWKRIAASIRKRDKVCQHCGKARLPGEPALDVHHIVPYRVSLDNDPSNLITLCRICHLKVTHQEVIPDTVKPVRSYTRDCRHCGKEFTTQSPYRKLCGAECKRSRIRQYGKTWSDRARAEQRPSYLREIARAKSWYEKNADAITVSRAAKYQANLEKERAMARERYQANKETLAARKRERYRADPEKIKDAERARYWANKAVQEP